MRKIVYYVASSLDGYISGPDDDISLFAQNGNGVDQYLQDLQDFDTVIMGRNTYEFGYKYGLKPGAAPYNMEHYLFSSTLKFEQADKKLHVCPLDVDVVKNLKNQDGTDIYLCGGGAFAGWLLDHELIDVLKLKLNPIVLGDGVRLFGDSTKAHRLSLTESKIYDGGLQIMNFDIGY